jgi:hypothetical protein
MGPADHPERMQTMRKWTWILGALLSLAAALPAGAAWTPAGVDLTRPRLLLRPGDVPVLHDRLAREPYRTLLERIVSQTESALGWDLDDDSIPAEREKSKAAKNLAFLYALDRTVVAGAVVPFPTPEARAAVGDRVRTYLLAMYTVSRIADTFDDDINTSEEIVSYATAYDTLVGAGYPLSPEDDAAIRENLIALTSDLYEDYLGLDPSIGTQTVFLTNNHRTKSGAALAIAGIALAEHTPDPAADPIGLTEPAHWVAYGLAQVDRVLRYAYLTGDGAYSEGPYYARYSGQNHLPLLFAVDRLVGGAEGPVFGVPQPNLWRHPLFARHQRWMLDMTLPDGSMAHIDDGTVARSYYYGMLSGFEEAPFYRWAWEFGVEPTVSDGSVDLAADQIVAFDDTIAAVEPTGSPTSFYVEGGNAIFRADWSRDAVMAVALGEHGIANEFARDEAGRGIPAAASHEQAEPGAYQLWAFGEQLAIDPGYFTFETRGLVAQPRHHNVVLVDGRGPGDPFTATLRWADRDAEPPTDGQSTISRPLDSGFVDAATVTSSYGGTLPGTTGSTPRALFERRFVFADDRYLLLADRITSSRSRAYQWLLHGNGGPGSDGLFEATPLGGIWTLRGARLSGAIGFDVGAPAFSTTTELHEIANREERSHTVLRATTNAERVRALTLLLPTRSGDAAPAIEAVAVDDGAGFRFTDAEADRVALALHRTPGLEVIAIDAASSDGSVWSFDARGDGSLRHAFADDARLLRWNGATLVEAGTHGRLAIRPEAERAEVVAETADAQVRVAGLDFAPLAADGACGLDGTSDGARVTLNRSRVFTLRASADNSAPAADAGASPRRANVGATLALDGSASCDLDGDPLTPRWELVSAPGGSAWSLEGADGWTPTLHADRRGPFRVRLVVTDAHGAASRAAEVVVLAGTACTDRVDQDLDGLIDALDSQCPSPGEGTGAACGLLGPELLIALLAFRRRIRRVRSARS